VTSECGDWGDNLADTTSNQNYANFGCSQQHNLAAMVANPQDIETPRTTTSASAARRNVVLQKYITGQDTTAQEAKQSKVKASESGSD
jgi:pilus assembly protein CpaD